MLAFRILAAVCLAATIFLILGCGGGSDCGVNGINVTPSTATADHTAAPPGNGQSFSAFFQFKNNPGCPAITPAFVNSNWTASDPSVHLSSSPASVVVATCTAALPNPVTITATPADGEMFTGRASLTCN